MEIATNRDRIITLLRSTNREGIEDVIKFLDDSQYYTLYGGHSHHKYRGGLAQHVLGVFDRTMIENESRQDKCPYDQVVIACLLHDLCKVKLPNGPGFRGHGPRSVAILNKHLGFKLNDKERYAIRYHMGSKCRDKEGYARHKNEPLLKMVHHNDCADAGNYPPVVSNIVKSVIDTFNL